MITSFRGEYRWLSNFWPCTIRMSGEDYPSAEHAFQAAKTLSPEMRKAIRTCVTPGQAKRMGRNVTLRDDWQSIKLDVMFAINEYKYSHYPQLMDKLLATGDEQLIEGNTWGDRYWGCTSDGNGGWVGENNLGIILMAIRQKIRRG